MQPTIPIMNTLTNIHLTLKAFKEVANGTVPVKCKLTVSTRNSILDPRCFSSFESGVSSIEFRVSSFEYRVSSFEYRVSRKLQVSETSHSISKSGNSSCDESRSRVILPPLLNGTHRVNDDIWARWPAKPPCHLLSFNMHTTVNCYLRKTKCTKAGHENP